jgi:hypothetical protein
MLECILPRAPRRAQTFTSQMSFPILCSLLGSILMSSAVAAAHMHTTIFGAEHADVLLLQCDTKSVSRCHILISKEKWHTFQYGS